MTYGKTVEEIRKEKAFPVETVVAGKVQVEEFKELAEDMPKVVNWMTKEELFVFVKECGVELEENLIVKQLRKLLK